METLTVRERLAAHMGLSPATIDDLIDHGWRWISDERGSRWDNSMIAQIDVRDLAPATQFDPAAVIDLIREAVDVPGGVHVDVPSGAQVQWRSPDSAASIAARTAAAAATCGECRVGVGDVVSIRGEAREIVHVQPHERGAIVVHRRAAEGGDR